MELALRGSKQSMGGHDDAPAVASNSDGGRNVARGDDGRRRLGAKGPTPTRPGSSLNWDGYCNKEVDKLIEQQSIEADMDRRKQLVWAIERKLAADGARPIIFYTLAATCWQPYVKGLTIMVNSLFNAWRMEDVWLDR
jgi:ABC-type transport system substrate-binding protein